MYSSCLIDSGSSIKRHKMTKKENELIWLSIERAAESLKVKKMTFWKWRNRGFVPRERHHDIVKRAEKLRYKNITHDVLYAQWLRKKLVK